MKITAWLPQEIPGAYSWRAGRRVVCGGDSSSSRLKVGGEAEETILHLLVGLNCQHALPLFVNQSAENEWKLDKLPP